MGVEGTYAVPTHDGGKGAEGYEFFSPLRQKERQEFCKCAISSISPCDSSVSQ